jgi:hypothetical protein
MKKTFTTPEARKAAIEAIERYSAGEINKDELAMKGGYCKILFFEKIYNGNFNCFMVLTPEKGFTKDHPDIAKFQNIPENNLPEGHVQFYSSRK